MNECKQALSLNVSIIQLPPVRIHEAVGRKRVVSLTHVPI